MSATTGKNDPTTVIKKEDGLLAYYFSAQLANLLVRLLAPLKLKPNHYTAASLALALGAAWLFQKGDYSSLLFGLVLLHFSFICDCADGQCARLTGQRSLVGHWFDYASDKIKDGVVLFGLALHVFHATPEDGSGKIFIIAFVALFFQFLRNITALNRDLFSLEQRGKRDTMHSPLAQHLNTNAQWQTSLRHSLLFKLSDRIFLLTIFALANNIQVFLFVYAILETVYAAGSSLLTFRLLRRFDDEQKNS